MLIVIDRGNTFTKLAAFRDTELVEVQRDHSVSVEIVHAFIKSVRENYPDDPITNGIFSSVGETNIRLIDQLNSLLPFLEMSSSLKLPVINRYSSRETLGHDRIAAAVGAAGFHRDKNILTIDAGSCITYDFITAGKEYLGGAITPGLQMRFKALHTFTARLPLVSLDGDHPLIGNTTETSIRSGILNGTLAEVSGTIDRYRESFPDLAVVLTGGDANYFERSLKNNIFAVPNLVLYGLKDILKYNVDL